MTCDVSDFLCLRPSSESCVGNRNYLACLSVYHRGNYPRNSLDCLNRCVPNIIRWWLLLFLENNSKALSDAQLADCGKHEVFKRQKSGKPHITKFSRRTTRTWRQQHILSWITTFQGDDDALVILLSNLTPNLVKERPHSSLGCLGILMLLYGALELDAGTLPWPVISSFPLLNFGLRCSAFKVVNAKR